MCVSCIYFKHPMSPRTNPFVCSQELPLDTFVFINAYSCCAGQHDSWGRAALTLCEVLSAAWRRPIALMSCYRLGQSATDPQQPPRHRCTGRCYAMDDAAGRDAYRQRLQLSLGSVCGFEASILAVGALAQYACLGSGGILPHAPVSYPYPKYQRSIESVWRSNTCHMQMAAGYDADHLMLDRVCINWVSAVTASYLRMGLPSGVRTGF